MAENALPPSRALTLCRPGVVDDMAADLLSVASIGADRLDTWRDGEGVVLSRAAVMPWPSREPAMGWPFSAGSM